MRFVDRSKVPAPAFLTGAKVARMRDRYLKFLSLDPRQRAQTRPPDRHLPPDTELDEALVRLFRGKCAFCEGRTRLLTYRFRPTSEALPLDTNDPEAHLAYGWLADVWQNLYPICTGCRPSQPNQFPVDGPRQPIPTNPPWVQRISHYICCAAGPGPPSTDWPTARSSTWAAPRRMPNASITACA